MLYKQKNCKKWYIYLRQNGRTIRLSTGTTSKTEARKIEATAQLSMFTTRERMNAILDVIFPDDVEAVKDKLPINGIETAYLSVAKDCVSVCADTTRKRISALKRLSLWAKENKINYVEQIDIYRAWAFINSCEYARVKTKRNVAGELSSIWNVFLSRGMVQANPWKELRFRTDGESEHGRAFSDEELIAIFRACDNYTFAPTEWHDAAIIALCTGLRLTDVKSLKKADLHEDGCLYITPSKTRKHGISVRIPARKEVAEVFTRRGNVLFPKIFSDTSHVPHFSLIIKNAGIIARKGEKLTFHCLRHTFATRLAEAGVPEDVRMALGGWTCKDTARCYNHDSVSIQKAIQAISPLP